MSLLFMGFVFIISSLVILYSDDYMFGDLNIVRFISLVLIFVVSIIFLIASPIVIRIAKCRKLQQILLQPVGR
jgi:NADH-ubiquinone oxidoreductase chain 5